MNVAFSYLWHLPVGDVALVLEIVEQLRQYAIKMGAEDVSNLIRLTGNEAHLVSSGASHVAMFDAVLPTVRSATLPAVGIKQYGLASSDGTSWKWSGVCRVSSFREIADFMDVAAHLGIKTHQMFAGTVRTAKKNLEGEVEYDQQYAIQIDLEYF